MCHFQSFAYYNFSVKGKNKKIEESDLVTCVTHVAHYLKTILWANSNSFEHGRLVICHTQ